MKPTLLTLGVIWGALISSAGLANAQEPPENRRIYKRVVDPVPFWIDANKLTVRDDPFAGNSIDTLGRGQQVKVYEQLENWMRISPDGQKARWINGDFTSSSRVTWANYNNFGSGGKRTLSDTVSDIELKRIPLSEESDSDIFSARIRELDSRRRVVDTRHNTNSGRYFERYLVQCDAGKPSHLRLLGEGYNYVGMNNDARNAYLSSPLASNEAINKEITSSDRQSIAAYVCDARS